MLQKHLYFQENLLWIFWTQNSEFCGFSIGVGGGIAIFFGLQQLTKDALVSLLIGNVWLIIFAWLSIIHFSRCEGIQREIRNSLIKTKKKAEK